MSDYISNSALIVGEFAILPSVWQEADAALVTSTFVDDLPQWEHELDGVDPPSSTWGVSIFKARADHIADRLDVMGFDLAGCCQYFDGLVTGSIELIEESPEYALQVSSGEIAWLAKLRWESCLDLVRSLIDGAALAEPLQLVWLRRLFEGNEIWMLRIAVDRADASTGVTHRVLLPREEDLCESAWEVVLALESRLASAAPVVVVTEGRTDARCLYLALVWLYPHLVGRFKFLDYADKPESNAPAQVRLIKAMASAGIANRVLAIFDNDTAAHEATESLHLDRHSRIAVMHYPDTELLRSYPTLGPSGLVNLDVNGTAGSLEMYLGRSALTDQDGTLRPIQWQGYSQRLNRYQGVVQGKEEVRRAFERRMNAATGELPDREDDEWNELRLVIDSMRQMVMTNLS